LANYRNPTPWFQRFFLHGSLTWVSFLLCYFVTAPVLAVELFFAEPPHLKQQSKEITKILSGHVESYLQKPIESVSYRAASALSGENNLVIALGPAALEEILSGPGTAPVLAVFITKAVFETIQSKYSVLIRRKYSAIFSDPDPYKQIALVKALYGAAASSAIIRSLSVGAYIEEYRKAAKAFGVKLNVLDNDTINDTSEFIRATKNNRSIILLKDKSLFDQISLEKVLLSSYDINHQGVIGYSRGLVKNGAVATTYSSIANIAYSIFLQVERIGVGLSIDSPQYTKQFEVALNKYVLRSLNLTAIDESTLKNVIASIIQEGSNQ
jgi:hypothetical protein